MRRSSAQIPLASFIVRKLRRSEQLLALESLRQRTTAVVSRTWNSRRRGVRGFGDDNIRSPEATPAAVIAAIPALKDPVRVLR